MNKLIPALVISTLLISPVHAEAEHQHRSDIKDQNMQCEMMAMMSHEKMMAMHEYMQKMQEMMAKIKVEIDPEKRQQLMQVHMQAMQEGMKTMHGGMSKDTVIDKNMTMAKDKPLNMGGMDMMTRMEMMEQRMGMMQMMMGQMMDHESESKKAPIHKHKE